MIDTLRPGQRIRVRQSIHRREGDWVTTVEGEILTVDDEKTGSWFAHSKDKKLWLKRIRLKKADGDLTTITLDQRSEVEVVG